MHADQLAIDAHRGPAGGQAKDGLLAEAVPFANTPAMVCATYGPDRGSTQYVARNLGPGHPSGSQGSSEGQGGGHQKRVGKK